jgi:hypothetical protein
MKAKIKHNLNKRMVEAHQKRINGLMEETGISYEYAREIVDYYNTYSMEKISNVLTFLQLFSLLGMVILLLF